MGAAYFIPTAVVPLLIITYALVFRLLLSDGGVAASPNSERTALIPGSEAEVMLMNYVVKLNRLGARPIAIVRHRAAPAELSKVVAEACGAVWNVIRSQNQSGVFRTFGTSLPEETAGG